MAEAHQSFERFEQGRDVAVEREGILPSFARTAAVIVAVMAAFLAIATFLSNEAVKEVITGETHRADVSAQLETNRLKIDVNETSSQVLKVLGSGSGLSEARAARLARAHGAHVAHQLEPEDARLRAEIAHHEQEVSDANTQHLYYELAEVGLQVGIVLASVSIIARRRWLLGAGTAAAGVGVVLILIGLLV